MPRTTLRLRLQQFLTPARSTPSWPSPPQHLQRARELLSTFAKWLITIIGFALTATGLFSNAWITGWTTSYSRIRDAEKLILDVTRGGISGQLSEHPLSPQSKAAEMLLSLHGLTLKQIEGSGPGECQSSIESVIYLTQQLRAIQEMHRLYPDVLWRKVILSTPVVPKSESTAAQPRPVEKYFTPLSAHILRQPNSQHLWECAIRNRFIAQESFVREVDRYISQNRSPTLSPKQ